MYLTLSRIAFVGLMAATPALPAFAHDPNLANDSSQQNSAPLPTMTDTFAKWSETKFSFEAMISNQRRSRPDFQFKIGEYRYQVVFDAGRAKRNAILDCLELADQCEIKGSAFMVFERGQMKLNVTDVTWLSIPAIDFDVQSARLHRCFRNASRKKKAFSSIVEAKLTTEDLERRQGYKLEPVKPRDGGRGYDLVESAVDDCMTYRFRLPVGSYKLKVYTQSGETFLDYWDE